MMFLDKEKEWIKNYFKNTSIEKLELKDIFMVYVELRDNESFASRLLLSLAYLKNDPLEIREELVGEDKTRITFYQPHYPIWFTCTYIRLENPTEEQVRRHVIQDLVEGGISRFLATELVERATLVRTKF